MVERLGEILDHANPATPSDPPRILKLSSTSSRSREQVCREAALPCAATRRPAGWHRLPPPQYRTLDEAKVNPALLDELRVAVRSDRYPIYLFGDVGVGKSFAAALVYCRWPERRSVMFSSYVELINTAIEAERSREVTRTLDDGRVIEMTKGQWWKWLAEVSLLVIDEIGTGNAGEWRIEMLWQVLEKRKGLPTLLTGNILLSDLESRFDARIQSRILEGHQIWVTGADRRRQGLENRVHKVRQD